MKRFLLFLLVLATTSIAFASFAFAGDYGSKKNQVIDKISSIQGHQIADNQCLTTNGYDTGDPKSFKTVFAQIQKAASRNMGTDITYIIAGVYNGYDTGDEYIIIQG